MIDDRLEEEQKLTSQDMAELIVDGLIQAKLIKQEDFEEAVKVATLEIDIRKTAGDY